MSAGRQAPDRNLALDLVRVTEAAAMAASRWMGRGDKEGADRAAVDAMRIVLQTVAMDGVVVIGEGEKDEAPMLFNGERIGDGTPPMTVITVDPLECMGGEMQTRLWPRNDEERGVAVSAGYDIDAVLGIDDLIKSDNCFFAATGVTDGELLRGVHFDGRGATTQSLVMRSKSGTVRRIEARHRLEKLQEFSAIEFG